MNKNSITDYLAFILFKTFGPLIARLPKGFTIFLGAGLGDLLYSFDLKHKALVYSNIKTAFGHKLSPAQLSNLTHEFYRAFGRNLVEIFFIPIIDKQYMNKYIHFEGLKFIEEAFKKGKGVILLSAHSGSWELSNIICANLGFPFSLFVRNQRYPRLEGLLNLYRSHRGCKIIPRNQTRYLIEALKKNEAIGMTVDQGGKTGMSIKFFGKDASMATGAVRLGLRYDSVILPAFYARINGPHIKTIIGPPVEIKKSQNPERDIHDNLQEIIHVFEKNIEKYPRDYLWSYKIWKYSKERNILIITDGRVGHLRQAQALAKIVDGSLGNKGIATNIDTVEINFKNAFLKAALAFSSCLAGKYHCQGCLWCLRTFLPKNTYKSLIGNKPDIIISCGSAVAPVNYVLSRENLAKSIAIMRPSILSTKRFDLAVIPRHDNPAKRKNIALTEGALNLIDDAYIRSQVLDLEPRVNIGKKLVIGLLLGGDTKTFKLSADLLKGVFSQVKLFLEKYDGEILITTSRRSDPKIEYLVKEAFRDYSRCKLLVIANEKNLSSAVGGILGLSQIIIISPESISMVSEAVNSKKYVIVFNAYGLGAKHERFLKNFAQNKYIYICENSGLSKKMENIWLSKPPVYTTKDNVIVSEAIKKIL
jgi:KDO2-lipid IV(A) lauroyltransferase